MEPGQFDDITRRLAFGATRRKIVKLLGGGVAAGALSRFRGSSAEAASKVGICHLTGSAKNPVVYITVSTNAIPAHQAHGDVINPDFQNDPANCGGCLISCDDGDPCTIDTCAAGSCVNTPIDCSGLNDQCNVGICIGGACEAQPASEGGACDDGNACTEGETCSGGVCGGGSAVNCDDGNACTTDSCDPATGCVHTAVNCDDGDACTNDSCDPASGCVHTPINCDDGELCTADSCVNGACVNEPIPGCCHVDDDCPRGQVCIDNVCTDNPNPECAGQSCTTFTPCSPTNGDCVCTTVTEGGGLCVPGSTPCSGLGRCPGGTGDCAAGELCVEASCCGENVCVPISLNEQCPTAGFAGFTAARERECVPGTIGCAD